ncbi:restriction endonuclease subunit S, partial [bacterium]|nr:restriction endonuclease subunit S [bacterium]
MLAITKTNWTHKKLGDICKKIGSGITPRGGEAVYSNSGATLIRSQNVYNNDFHYEGLAYINDEIADKMKSVQVQEKDVLLNITGDSVARCSIVPESILPARVNQHVSIIRPQEAKLNPHFLMYYLVSPYMQKYMLSLAGSGGTRKALTKSMIEDFSVPIPNIETQTRIASILSAYDDLIENNRRRIQLLEGSARLLYRECFVHLRFPGHEHVKIIDGVPEGWEKKKIADVCETVGGGTPSTKNPEYWLNGNITWITPTDVTRNDSLALLQSERKITLSGLKKSSAKLVPPFTILMTSRASIGYFALMAEEVCTNQGFINIIPNSNTMSMYILYNLMNRVDEILLHASGSTYKEISKGEFRTFDIIIPSKNLLG